MTVAGRCALLGDGQTNGATVATSNGGQRSGCRPDLVSIGTGAALTYDTAQKLLGSASVKVATTGTPANCFARHDDMFRPARYPITGVAWMFWAASPAASATVQHVIDNAAARICELRVLSTGHVRAYDSAAAAAVTTVAPIALGQWVRVEWDITPDAAAGAITIRLYNTATATVPTETVSAAGLNLRTATGPFRYINGVSNGSLNVTYNAHFAWSDLGGLHGATGFQLSSWIFSDTPSTVRCSARVLAVSTGVRLQVSTAPDLATAPVFSSSALPDAFGAVRLQASGLVPDTLYYFGLEIDGLADPGSVGTFRTLPPSGVPWNGSFAAASCARASSNSAVFDEIRARVGAHGTPARFFHHLGDIHYGDDNVNDQAVFEWRLDRVMSAPRQLAFYSGISTSYCGSDHDLAGTPNGSGSSVALPATQATFRSRVPSPTLPAADGLGTYYSYTVGATIRVIVTDGRSYSSAIAATDDAAKTKLGAVQKAWLKQQLVAREPVKVWMHEDAWRDGGTYAGQDTWRAYSTERAELGAFIEANEVRVLFVHGDFHSLAFDDGSHNTVGGFPIATASPLDQDAYTGNEPAANFTSPPYPAAGTAPVQQYGWFDVTDDGATCTIAFTGYDVAGTIRASGEAVFAYGGGLVDFDDEYEWFGARAAGASMADRQLAYFSALSGLPAGRSLADYKRAVYGAALGLSGAALAATSLTTLEIDYWRSVVPSIDSGSWADRAREYYGS